MWFFVLIYLLVGCIRTAYQLADMAMQTENLSVNVSSTEMGFSVIFWGINIVVMVLGDLFIELNTWGDDE
jgi:hypothetical protein|nr:MAG TPA: hypothetical protein [Caudoviricetes sp.]